MVEMVVAAAIMVVVGAVMITILSLSSSQVKSSIRSMKMCMGYDIAVSDIGQSVRSAQFALNSTDPYPPTASAACTVSTMFMRSPTGAVIAGYNITNTYRLQEYDVATSAWKDFKINPADSTITLTSSPTSNFIISPSRKVVTLNLNVYVNYGGAKDTLKSGKESFLCRNQ